MNGAALPLVHTNVQAVWNNCLQLIQENVSPQAFRTWFEPIVPLKMAEQVLTLQVPSQYFYEWLEENYLSLLRTVIDKELGETWSLEYSIIVDRGKAGQAPIGYNVQGPAGKPAAPKPQAGNTAQRPGQAAGLKNPFSVPSLPDELLHESHLIPQYTFESLVEGDCNRLARSAGIAVANKPGFNSFNPLLIYGGVGLGKTHLVNAIGNRIKQTNPEKFVLYVSTEKFTNQFIDAVANNSLPDFTSVYMQVDVLIIDDVQFLAGKEKTQEMFFNIFNHLHQKHKQIILTSDCPPKDLKGMQERLQNRFRWGLTVDVQQPDFETRAAIIRKKMSADGVEIPSDVVDYLARTVDSNVRELEGVLIRLIAESSLARKDFDLALAKQIVQNLINSLSKELDVDLIQKVVSEYFSVSVEALKDKTRKKEITQARMVAMYFTKHFTDYTLKSIGEAFGGRDHSTVLHAIETVNNQITTSQEFRADIQELERMLKPLR